MALKPLSSHKLLEELKTASRSATVVDTVVLERLHQDLAPFVKSLAAGDISWQDFEMFWPPRIVEAFIAGELIPFFGAGVSFAAGLPSWDYLLRNYFDLAEVIAGDETDDEELKHDFLTRAELAAQRIGANRLQSKLREVVASRAQTPTASHWMIAALRCPIMITTIYDWLLEEAWRKVNPRVPLDTVVNDSDLGNYPQWTQYKLGGDQALLLKIHGCAGRPDEQLVLTRRDYRHHSRTNKLFFETVAEILAQRHVLFLGFSHRDPEVEQLVEGSIYKYEQEVRRSHGKLPATRPHFYSLQFDMRRHTPEIFAAKGLVALTPPISDLDPKHSKSAGVCRALADLMLFRESGAHKDAALDHDLSEAVKTIAADVNKTLNALDAYEQDALAILKGQAPSVALADLLGQLGTLASQGVYALDDEGRTSAFEVPVGLDRDERNKISEFSTRPYFRMAKTFREEFASDSARSIYNGLSTIFFCKPLADDRGFAGLLFSAAQIGTWRTPIDVAKSCWSAGLSLLLLDSEGVLLLPPHDEIPLVTDNEGPGENEPPSANIGYDFYRLLAHSRRDLLARHIVDNIVPLSQDDDITRLSLDVEYYSVVVEIPRTRWKLAICRPMYK